MADEKELKLKLRSAKELIQQKDYKNAQRECEAVLKIEPKNYTALVFSGLCQTELNEAIDARKSYETATNLEPSQLLAWQGFAQFHEKFSIYDDNYCRCLYNLHDLTNDLPKKFDISIKLAKLYAKMNKVDEALNECANLLKSSSPDKTMEIENLVIDCVGNSMITNPDLINLISTCFKRRTFNGEMETVKNEIGLKYCRFLMRHDKQKDAFEIAKILAKNENPAVEILSVVSFEIVIRFFSGNFDRENDAVTLCDVLERFQKIVDENEENFRVNFWVAVLESMSEQIDGNFDDALQILDDVENVDKMENDMKKFYYGFLAVVHLKLNNHDDSLKFCEKCFQLLNDDNKSKVDDVLKIKLTYVKAESLFWINETENDGNLTEIQKLYDKTMEKSVELKNLCLTGVARCNFLQNGDLTTALDSLKAISPVGDVNLQFNFAWIYFKSKKFDDALSYARKVIDMDAKNNFFHLILGKILWHSGVRDGLTMKEFLESARLNSNSWESFYYLALCQTEINKNDERAVQCLERANALNAYRNRSAGETLSDLYKKLKLDDKNVEFLKKCVANLTADKGFWAYFRLGVELFNGKRADEAISVFQTMLRSHSKSSQIWERLGDAYFARGSFASSLKAFEKVVELDETSSSSFYARYRIAYTKMTLNFNDEAATKFDELLQLNENYVPALLGYAESSFKASKTYFAESRYVRSLALRRLSLATLTRCAELNSNLCVVWKLLGDVLTSLNEFDENFLGDESKLDVLRRGARSYMKAVAFRPQMDELWHDLAVNFYYQTKLDASNLTKALECAKQSIRLNSNVSKYWSTLGCIGVVGGENVSPAFVQCCFVKSLQLDARNANAWTNLGLFYLRRNETALSHECFKRAQSADPEFVNAWIGQALIAEKLAPSETMDLFRHASELANHPEGQSGYAFHVLSTFTNLDVDRKSSAFVYAVRHLFAIPMARDCLSKYCQLRPNDTCALNLLGIFNELEGLLNSAKNCYAKALAMTKNDEQLNSLRWNLLRVSAKLNDAKNFDGCVSKLTKCATFAEFCSLALSFYRLNRFKESLTTYEDASKLATSILDNFYVKLAQTFIVLQQSRVDEALKFYDKHCSTVQVPLSTLLATTLALKQGRLNDDNVKKTLSDLWTTVNSTDFQRWLICFMAVQNVKLDVKLAVWIVHQHPYLLSSRYLLLNACGRDNKANNVLKTKLQNGLQNVKPENETDLFLKWSCAIDSENPLEKVNIIHLRPDLRVERMKRMK